MTVLQRKNPIRIAKNRTNMRAVVNLPQNAWLLSRDMAFSTIYIGLGFSSFVLGRMFHTMESLLTSVNTKAGVENLLANPWAIFSPGQVTKIYEVQYESLFASRY